MMLLDFRARRTIYCRRMTPARPRASEPKPATIFVAPEAGLDAAAAAFSPTDPVALAEVWVAGAAEVEEGAAVSPEVH